VNLLGGVIATLVLAATLVLTGALVSQFSMALGLIVSVSPMS
jgi:hypothetical protein